MLQQALTVDGATLYPDSPPRAKLEGLRIADLPVEPVQPPGWLVQSVKRRGVLEPVIALDYGDEGLRIKSGKRRVEAARKLGLTYVPGYVFDADDWQNGAAAALSLLSNNQRSNNAVDEYEAIVELAVTRRISVQEIADATGITAPSVRAALTLTSLPPAIIDAMKEWKIKYAVCRRIAALSYKAQLALAEVLALNGTITARDVRPYWQAEKKAPKSGDLLAGDPIHAWSTSTVDALKGAFEKAPHGVPIIALSGIHQALTALEADPAKSDERIRVNQARVRTAMGSKN